MSSLSDLSAIQSDIIKEKVKEFYSGHLKSSEVQISVESGSKHGDNFIGIVYRVSGEANRISNGEKASNDGDNKSFKIILKVAPTNTMRREKFSSRLLFLREIFLYNEVRE